MKLFIKKGGKFKKEKVISIKKTETNQINIKTSSGESLHDRVVITSGVWSNDLLKHIGDKVPLEAERGYHLVNPELKNIVKRPISWQERGTYFTPMSDGLRTGGIVEFGALNETKNERVLNFLNRALKEVFPSADLPQKTWVGFRPSVPDSLPVIGQSPKNPYIYYNFGHQHIGWSLGGISGKLVAQQICANNTDLDLSPYSVKRFKL